MGRKKAKPKIINVMRLKKSESQIRNGRQMSLISKLQQVMEEFYNENRDLSNSDCKLLYTRNKRQAFPRREFVHTNIHNKNVADKRIPSFIEQYKAELSFVQTIVWLKSATACVSQMSIEQLQRIFNKQCSIRDNDNYRKNGHIGDVYIERSRCSINKDLPIYEGTKTKNTFVMSSPLNIFTPPYNVTSQRTIYKSYTSPEGTRNKTRQNYLINKSPIKPLMPERYITANRKKENFLSRPCVIPEIIAESSSHSSNMFEDSVLEHQNECLELEEDARFLLQTASKNDIERVNKENIQDKNIFLSQEGCANVFNKYKSVLPMRDQYVNEPTLDLEYNFDGKCFTPIISQYNLIETLASDDSPKSFVRTQINISQESNAHNDNNFEFEIDNKNFCTRMNDIAVGNSEHDSAYSTSRIDVLNYDGAITAESTVGDKHMPDTNTGYRYELRPRNKKITEREKVTASPSIIQGAKNFRKRQASSKKQFPSKENKSERAKNLSEKEKTNKDDMISANWLNFTLESLNVEDIIFASVKVILSTISDKRIAEEYAIHNCWKGTLKEEAINVILNASDTFQIEKKPNIFIKEIVTTIVKTLDEMTTCVELNQTYVWILHIQIILELCNSLPVCVQIIDHLIQKLKSFQSVLIDTIVWQNMYIMINQLHLIFYALNIVVQKYHIIISNDKKCQSADNTLPHVADLWKIRYINKEFENAGLNLDAAKEHWLNTLEDFTMASLKYFVQFAEKSQSLVHALISQSPV